MNVVPDLYLRFYDPLLTDEIVLVRLTGSGQSLTRAWTPSQVREGLWTGMFVIFRHIFGNFLM